MPVMNSGDQVWWESVPCNGDKSLVAISVVYVSTGAFFNNFIYRRQVWEDRRVAFEVDPDADDKGFLHAHTFEGAVREAIRKVDNAVARMGK